MYIPSFITDTEEYRACVVFHGHTCMGLTIGYLAAKCGLEELQASRAGDEELVVIVENDACCCDAIQVLTGCTFGKGNFFFRDLGKMAFTFGRRDNGTSIRLVFRNDIMTVPAEEREMADQIAAGTASVDMIRAYESISEKRIDELFAAGPGTFFTVQPLSGPLPPYATVAPSSPCSQCGEMVMSTKLAEHRGTPWCRECLEAGTSVLPG